MDNPVTDWLPESAFTQDAVKAALVGLIGDWSARWFVRSNISVAAIQWRNGPLFSFTAKCLHFRHGCVAVDLSQRGKRSLLDAALGADLSQLTLAEGDRKLLEAFTAQVVEDFIARLDQALAGSDISTDAGKWISLTLVAEGNELLSVVFPDYAIVPALKSAFGNARPPTGNLQPRLVALAPTPVIAEALLGRAEVGANDLNGLAAGDVLLLDRELQEPVELRLCGSANAFVCGRLGRRGDRMSIEL